MGKDAIRLSTVLAATPQVIFRAWLDSTQHASFTNDLAKIDGNIGGKFALRDGKVTGRTMALEFGRRLLQSWRNTDFPKAAPDSRLEVLFESVGAGTRLTVMHADLPEGMGEPLRTFWTDAYFGPMTDYFGRFATLLANTPPSQAVIFVEDEDEEPEPPKPKKKKLGDKPEKAPVLALPKDEKPAKKAKDAVEKPKSVPPPSKPKVAPAPVSSKPAKVKAKAEPSKPAKAAKPSKPAKAVKAAKPSKPAKAVAKPAKPKAAPKKAAKAAPAKKAKPAAKKEKPKAKPKKR